MPTARDSVTAILAELVEIDSINPAFTGGVTSEREIAHHVADLLSHLGLEVALREPEPGRASVVGRLRGTGGGGGRSLILYAHLDTVGVDGMAAPFEAAVREGRLYGRGSYDMKGGLAACCEAARLLAAGPRPAGDVLVVGVADEEVASLGMQDVLRDVRADAAIVTEPTELDICLAHKGFCWLDVTTVGRAAHGSRFDLGIDANMRMGRVLARLEILERALRGRPPHPLVGPPSLHAAVLHGGTGPSTYAAECRLEIERRAVPGETEPQVLEEIEAILRALRAEDPGFAASVRSRLWRDPFEVSPDAAVVRTVRAAAREVLGREPALVGQTPWMDAAFLAAAGIETVVIGPAGAGAHAAEEWVELDSVAQLAEILAAAARAYCGR